MKRHSVALVMILSSILFSASVSMATPVFAVSYQPGVKQGDWWQYGDVKGSCPDPCPVPGLLESLKVQSAITRVTSVQGTNVSVDVIITYVNGTAARASYSGDLNTGQGNLPDGLAMIAANLNPGDHIYNSPFAPTLNTTILKPYAGAVRQANIWNVTTPQSTTTVTFDKLTGIILANVATIDGATISDQVTGTDLWFFHISIEDDVLCTQNGTTCTFAPSNATIIQGTAVLWSSNGSIVHTVTACTPNTSNGVTGCPSGLDMSNLPSFDSGLIIPGATFSFSFNVPGTYYYFDELHPWLHGILSVQPNVAFPPFANPPIVNITRVSPNPANTGQTVTVSFTINSATTVLDVAVHWGDGTISHPGVTSTSDQHTYSNIESAMSQVYTINVTATNAGGQGSAASAETVNDRPPILTITSLSPNPASPGQLVRLNFTATDPDGVVTTTWVDWGDGSKPDLIFQIDSPSMCQRLTNPGTSACTLAVGDLILAQTQDPTTIANDSIIIFRPNPQFPEFLVVHRVIGIIPPSSSVYSQTSFRTKGDANFGPDCWTQTCYIPGSWIVAVYNSTLAPPQGGPGTRYDTHTYVSSGNSRARIYTIRLNATDNSGFVSRQSIAETIQKHASHSHVCGGYAISDLNQCQGDNPPSGQTTVINNLIQGTTTNNLSDSATFQVNTRPAIPSDHS